MDAIKTILRGWQNTENPPGRPRILLSYAQSLDGSIAARRGVPLMLSSTESLSLTHGLRAASDAILVGIGTILSDDPQLTVRFAQGRNPVPVVLDSHVRISPQARVLKNSPAFIAATNPIESRKAATLESRGVTILSLPAGEDNRVELQALLTKLDEMDIKSLMVEGGATVITSFLTHRLVDYCVLTIAPIFIGGLRAVESLPEGNGFPLRTPLARLDSPSSAWCGKDLIIWGKPAWNA